MPIVKLAEPNDAYRDEVVERLESLLDAARSGEILSILYACDRPGGTVTIGSTRIKDRYMMLGYLAYQTHMLNQSLDETSIPSDLTEGA